MGAAAVANGWLETEWLVIFAVALSVTMLISSPLNTKAQSIYLRFQKKLLQFESSTRLKEDAPIVFSNEEVIVFGMGRTGSEVYRVMSEKFKKSVLGVDINLDVINKQLSLGNNVIQGDVTDLRFWQRVNLSEKPPLAILATPSHAAHMRVIEQLNKIHCSIKVAVIGRYDDELEELTNAGADVVFNLYEEAGFGFANHTFNQIYGSTAKI